MEMSGWDYSGLANGGTRGKGRGTKLQSLHSSAVFCPDKGICESRLFLDPVARSPIQFGGRFHRSAQFGPVHGSGLTDPSNRKLSAPIQVPQAFPRPRLFGDNGHNFPSGSKQSRTSGNHRCSTCRGQRSRILLGHGSPGKREGSAVEHFSTLHPCLIMMWRMKNSGERPQRSHTGFEPALSLTQTQSPTT
ncbi:hypothetical protein J6590_065840 [Homalodisca vitripennis]|nr:hypothetical protein J6590_065840 [Homalodisca vitripennis]